MDRCMNSPITTLIVCCLLSATLSGCSLGELNKSELSDTSSKLGAKTATILADKAKATDDKKNIIDSNSMRTNKDVEDLKSQLMQQQQRLEAMSNEQQALQEQLKRQNINLQIIPATNANAGRARQGTASTAYVAFLEDESQFAEVEELAFKEITIIPNRESSIKLNIPQGTRFIAIKVGLRYTKKRSQLLIPIGSIDFDSPLSLNIGACDINIKEGIDPELTPTFTTKLKYYQQPLVSCL